MSYRGKAELDPSQVDSILGAWLERELEVLGLKGQTNRRRTRHELAHRLSNAMRGQFVLAEEASDDGGGGGGRHGSRGLSADERIVVGADDVYPAVAAARAAIYASASAAAAASDRDFMAQQLTRLQDDMGALHQQQSGLELSQLRDAYERKLAQRDDHIRELQERLDFLEMRDRETLAQAERTQHTLEDALLERSIELAELRARHQQCETKLFSLQHATAQAQAHLLTRQIVSPPPPPPPVGLHRLPSTLLRAAARSPSGSPIGSPLSPAARGSGSPRGSPSSPPYGLRTPERALPARLADGA